MKSMLMHICCGPDATYAYEYFSRDYNVSGYFCNMNIDTEDEFVKRYKQAERVAEYYGFNLILADYDNNIFIEQTKGMEHLPEQSDRCLICHEINMRKTAEKAVELRYDTFSTTLTISPHKMAEKINEIGVNIAMERGIEYIPSILRKNEGFKRSIEMSKQLELYRQDYCGCIYSRR